MPRRPRLHVPGACYHVTLRGNHKEPLFASAADYRALNGIVARAVERFDMRLHAFCWMTNHLHALVQIGEQKLGGIVKSIAVSFARYRHRLLDTSGHLFERRYGSRLIDVDSYFLAVLRYIHRNPVEAGMVRDPRAYPWSSHRVYLGTQSIDWITTGLGLSLFHADPRIARSEYVRFVEGAPAEDEQDFDDDAGTSDPRILGSDEFVASLNPIAGRRQQRPNLEELACAICAKHGVSVDLLRSRSSQHSLTPIRVALLEQAVTGGIANLTQVARFLGRDPSTLSKQWKARGSMSGTWTGARQLSGPENPTIQ